MPADIKYPTDSGLLVRGITKTARLVVRIQAAGVAARTGFDDTTALARQAAHRIGSKLRRRREDAKAEVLAITGGAGQARSTHCERAHTHPFDRRPERRQIGQRHRTPMRQRVALHRPPSAPRP